MYEHGMIYIFIMFAFILSDFIILSSVDDKKKVPIYQTIMSGISIGLLYFIEYTTLVTEGYG